MVFRESSIEAIAFDDEDRAVAAVAGMDGHGTACDAGRGAIGGATLSRMFLAGTMGAHFHENAVVMGVTMVLALITSYGFTEVFGNCY